MNKIFQYGILLLLMVACQQAGTSTLEKPVISVSIAPQQYFIGKLAGDRVDVNVMVPPGASPATYEPTAIQLGKLEHSVMYMKIGHLGYELSWMDRISSLNPSMEVVDLSKGIKLMRSLETEEPHPHHDHNHRGIDPHTWMSARNAKIIASAIYKSLLQLLPGDRDFVTSNYGVLMQDLDSLDNTIARMLSGAGRRSFMIYHPALTYFARDYDLEQIPLELEGKDPSPGHMKKIADLGNELHIPVIFIQSQFDQKNAQVLAEETGAEIVPINPLDTAWYKQMLYIASQLEASFQ